MKFEYTAVFNFEGAFRGMRNPKESWAKSDSCIRDTSWDMGTCKGAILYSDGDKEIRFILGPNDLNLAQSLIKAGSEHRKFMRQIFVSVDITAPLYWWKEFDTYKVGTVSNSTSTMHKLASTPITKECFEMDDFENFGIYDRLMTAHWKYVIDICERLRQKYHETEDKRYWKELIRVLPESWLQKRTVTFDYENLLAMCSKGQRRFHKLTEWSKSFMDWARSLPYAQELIFLDELDKQQEEKKNG
jgi:hypothetical protein